MFILTTTLPHHFSPILVHLLRYESCTYLIKFLWQYESDILQKCHQLSTFDPICDTHIGYLPSPISSDLSSGNDIGFHTIELLLTFDSGFSFLLSCNLNTIFINFTHTQHAVSYNFMLYFSHIMIIRITLSVKFFFISTVMQFCSTRSSP